MVGTQIGNELHVQSCIANDPRGLHSCLIFCLICLICVGRALVNFLPGCRSTFACPFALRLVYSAGDASYFVVVALSTAGDASLLSPRPPLLYFCPSLLGGCSAE